MGGLIALAFGAASGALLLVLLALAESALGLEGAKGLGHLWLFGVGLGLWLPSRVRGPWSGGLLLLALLAPLGPGLVNTALADLFWDSSSGDNQASLLAWQAQLALGGVLLGVAARGRLVSCTVGLALGAGGMAWAGVGALESLPSLVVCGASVALLSLGLQRLTSPLNRERGSLSPIDEADDLPVMRPRLGGLFLCTLLGGSLQIAFVCRACVIENAHGSSAVWLGVLTLGLGIGMLFGQACLSILKRMPGAELAPLCLLFAACTSAVSWAAGWTAGAGAALQESLGPVWGGVGMAAVWMGPSALCAGGALAVVPALTFSGSAAGRMRRGQLVASALALCGLLWIEPAANLILVDPGPELFLGTLLLLVAAALFLSVELRPEGIGIVRRRFGPLQLTAWRTVTVGCLLASALALASSRPFTESCSPCQPGQSNALESGEVLRAAQVLGALLGHGELPGLWVRGERSTGEGPWKLDVSLGVHDARGGSLAALAELRSWAGAAPVAIWLPLGQKAASLPAVLDSIAGSFPFASLWLVEGQAFVIGAPYARRTAATFIGVLRAGSNPLEDWQRIRPLGVQPEVMDSRRLRARHLEQLAARRSLLPVTWAEQLGELPELQLTRSLVDMRVAAAWLAHCKVNAPGSLALESWRTRLEAARAKAQSLGPEDSEFLVLSEQLGGL